MTDIPDTEHKKMTLIDHLDALRSRLIKAAIGTVVGMVLVLFFSKQLFAILQSPYVRAMEALGKDPKTNGFISTSGVETFIVYMKISLVFGLIVAAPWVFYQIWQFIAEGLYKKERKITLTAVPFCCGLFVAGALFYLFVVSIPMMKFFIGFNDWLGVTYMPKLVDHINMVLTMMVVFGLGFQLPVLVIILGKVGIVSHETLCKYRRHVIVFIFIFAAFATSPSPIDQVLLAIPLYLLYEVGVFMVGLGKKKRLEKMAKEEEYYLKLEEEIAKAEAEAAKREDLQEEASSSDEDDDDDYPDPDDDSAGYDSYEFENDWYDDEYKKELEFEQFGIFGKGDGEKFFEADTGALGGNSSDDFLNMMLNRSKNEPDDSKK